MLLFQAYKKKRFLIVDDFDNFIFSMRQMLRSMGIENIDTAKTGQEAVAACVRNQYDVVFCDYNMGDSNKNGQQVLEELRHRKLLKNTAIFIIVSAEVAKDMVFGAMEYQPDGYITKPITQSSLQKRLDVLIEQKENLRPILEALDLCDYSRAIALCDDEIKRGSKHKSWCIKTKANLYYLSGDLAHAKEMYQDIIAQRPLDWARLGLGKVLLAEQKIDEALATFHGILTDNPQLVEAYDWMAEAYRQQGNLTSAQNALKNAVSISPRALLRQKSLAEVSLASQDLETATAAYRATARLSENSVHESSEIYLSFGRCLSDLAEGDNGKVGDAMANEALKTLEKVRTKFGNSPEIKLQSFMVETRVHAGQGNSERGHKALKQAREVFSALEEASPELVLEMAQTLFAAKETQQAQQLLRDLSTRCAGNPEILAKIEEMMDEPVGLKDKIRAREFNRIAIRAYEQGNHIEATKQFQEALRITPNHTSLNLNLTQVLMKRIEAGDSDTTLLSQCQAALRRIGHIPEQHRQYKRFVHFDKKVEELRRKANGTIA